MHWANGGDRQVHSRHGSLCLTLSPTANVSLPYLQEFPGSASFNGPLIISSVSVFAVNKEKITCFSILFKTID